MKIRNGFVANSSSASYILTIPNISMSLFYNDIMHELDIWDTFVGRHIASIDNELNKDTKYIATKQLSEEERDKVKYNNIKYYPSWEFMIRERKERHSHIMKELRAKDNTNGIMAELLRFIHHIEIERDGNNVQVTGFSTMHNSFGDMPDVFKNIMGYYLDQGKPITLRTEHDS